VVAEKKYGRNFSLSFILFSSRDNVLRSSRFILNACRLQTIDHFYNLILFLLSLDQYRKPMFAECLSLW
jgi:hypothetical protein